MNIRIKPHCVNRVNEAIKYRRQLLRMRTDEMPRDYSDQLAQANSTIAAAVAVNAPKIDYGQQYLAVSRGY